MSLTWLIGVKNLLWLERPSNRVGWLLRCDVARWSHSTILYRFVVQGRCDQSRKTHRTDVELQIHADDPLLGQVVQIRNYQPPWCVSPQQARFHFAAH